LYIIKQKRKHMERIVYKAIDQKSPKINYASVSKDSVIGFYMTTICLR